MSRDPEKAKARQRRYRERQKVKKFGPAAAGADLRGRHGNHATGARNARWNRLERRVTSHGYVAVRVPVDHPHGWGPTRLRRFKYAYEHVLVMMESLARPLGMNEVVHHRDGDRTNNNLDNLELTSPSEHQRYHTTTTRDRDRLGKFV